jgi:FkbM family methyltransferase
MSRIDARGSLAYALGGTVQQQREGSFKSVAVDIKQRLPKLHPNIIFDVGANRGQTVRALRAHYPDAVIHAFEPVSSTFTHLRNRYNAEASVRLNKLALGAQSGVAVITANAASTGNKIVTAGKGVTEEIFVTTGDEYCSSHEIPHVNILKVDTEGFDLNVLKGFSRMLSDQAIDLIQVEASMNATNRKHVPFNDFVLFLSDKRYYLFQIYEQTFERDGRPIMRRSNPVFCSARVAEDNRHRVEGEELGILVQQRA